MAIVLEGKMGPPPQGAVNFGPRDNRGQSPNPSLHSDKSDSGGHEPELSTVAAKRITRLSTKKNGSRIRENAQRLHNFAENIHEPQPDSNCGSATKLVRALHSGFRPSHSKQPLAPPTDMGIRALRSGRKIGRETDLKEVFLLSARTVVNSSGKCDLAAMAEDDEPNGLVDAAEHLR